MDARSRRSSERTSSYDSDAPRPVKKSKMQFSLPSTDELQERLQYNLEEFQVAFKESLPSAKEFRSHLKLVRKSYRRFNKEVNRNEWLDEIEDRTHIPRFVVVWSTVGLMALVTILSFFVRFMGIFMTRFLGFLFPVYASIKALISERKDDDTQWLMYWVVYAAFSLFEQIALEQSKVLPLFFMVKLAFLSWCQFLNGAEFLYKILIKPFILAFRAIGLIE